MRLLPNVIHAPPKRNNSMSNTVAEFVFERLQEWGVNRIYGFPGDGIQWIVHCDGPCDGQFYVIDGSRRPKSAGYDQAIV